MISLHSNLSHFNAGNIKAPAQQDDSGFYDQLPDSPPRRARPDFDRKRDAILASFLSIRLPSITSYEPFTSPAKSSRPRISNDPSSSVSHAAHSSVYHQPPAAPPIPIYKDQDGDMQLDSDNELTTEIKLNPEVEKVSMRFENAMFQYHSPPPFQASEAYRHQGPFSESSLPIQRSPLKLEMVEDEEPRCSSYQPIILNQVDQTEHTDDPILLEHVEIEPDEESDDEFREIQRLFAAQSENDTFASLERISRDLGYVFPRHRYTQSSVATHLVPKSWDAFGFKSRISFNGAPSPAFDDETAGLDLRVAPPFLAAIHSDADDGQAWSQTEWAEDEQVQSVNDFESPVQRRLMYEDGLSFEPPLNSFVSGPPTGRKIRLTPSSSVSRSTTPALASVDSVDHLSADQKHPASRLALYESSLAIVDIPKSFEMNHFNDEQASTLNKPLSSGMDLNSSPPE